ncbi:ATP-binding protein [Candidatus Desantisbacteria bacterium]|nr:ATP-binding protein [Candidatus Desantisbacteria bacterium]
MKRFIWNQLLQWKEKKDRKPLILKGVRQVGKTYILRSFAEANFSNVHYINFEKDEQLASIFNVDLSPERILKELSFHLNLPIDPKNDIILFDEIQNAPKALTSLKYFYEEMPEMAICSAGSLLGLHLGNEAFPVGKVDFLELYPFSFAEFLRGTGDQKSYIFLRDYSKGQTVSDHIHNHLWEQLKIYFIVGGLPEVINTYVLHKNDLFSAMEQVRKKQKDLIIAYNADMAKHSGKQNAMHLERLFRNIPAQLAKEQNLSVSRFRFKGIIPGINRYSRLADSIDWLINAGLIFKSGIINRAELPFSAYTKENFFKLYLFDPGILGALSDLPPKTILDYAYGSYKGYFAENYVACEFKCFDSKNLFSWQENTAEVEFIREINGSIFPIEIKSGNITQAKSLKVFADKYNPPYRTVMSGKKPLFDDVNKLHNYPLYLASRFPI